MRKIIGHIDENGFPNIPDVTIINTLNNTAIKPRAITDPGAAGLHVKTDIIQQLELEKVDGAFTRHPTLGRQPIDIYQATLEIQGLDLGTITVRTMLDDFPFDLIIGCGFIKDGKMVYDGVTKTIEIMI